MPKKHKMPTLNDPLAAVRIDIQEYKRPCDGRRLKIKWYVFPCKGGCDSEVRIRSGNLNNLKAGRCRECFNKSLVNKFRLQPFEAMYNTLVANGKKRNRTDSLTYEEFLRFTKIKECHYCGAGVMWSPFNSHVSRSAYNLDRKNNWLGYSEDNCVVCCWRCNLVKGDTLTYEQMVRLSPILREFTKEAGGKAVAIGRKMRERSAAEEGQA